MKHGFERYCKDYENIENYEKAKADNFKGWECHHRLETHTPDGERRLVDITHKELKALGMYYNRPASELIFLTSREHHAIRKVSTETRQKLRETKKGEKNPMYGKPAWNKGKKMSEEQKKKIGATNKGKNIWTKGKHWYNNGKENMFCFECPPGFVPGMLK